MHVRSVKLATLLPAVFISFLLPQTEVSAQELSGSAKACQTEYLAAGVGSSSSTTTLWVPQTRAFNLQIATPQITLKFGGQNAAVGREMPLPSVPLFSTKQTFTWNGSAYQGTTRTTTVGPWTWTDRSATIRGVCVSYASAVDEFLAKR